MFVGAFSMQLFLVPILLGLFSLTIATPASAQEQSQTDSLVATIAQEIWDPSQNLRKKNQKAIRVREDLKSYDRFRQIQQLRREGILKEYDRSKRVSVEKGEPRTKVLRELVTSSSTSRLNSSLSLKYASDSERAVVPHVEGLEAFQTNVRRALQNTKTAGLRIWHGAEVKEPDRFPDSVVIVGNNQLCSGTLITSTQVLTAAHCFCRGVTQEVTVGHSLINFRQRAEVDLQKSKTNINCSQLTPESQLFRNINRGDLALYKLKKPITGIPFRRIATEESLRAARPVTAVGFGRTSQGESGTKFYVEILVASYDCTDQIQGPYNCLAHSEMIAAGLNKDTCEGDSGGPVLAQDGRALDLVGVTSRSLNPDGRCGSGGIYVKLTTPEVRNWLMAHGVPKASFAD